MKKTTMIVCIVLGLSLVIAGIFVGMREGFSSDSDYWETETVLELDIGSLSAIEIETKGMDVHVYDGWSKTVEVDVSVKCVKDVQVWEHEGTLYVRDKSGNSFRAGDRGQILIWLPKGGQGVLSVTTESGDASVSGIRGESLDVRLTTASGDLSVYSSRIKSLTGDTASGDFYLNEVEVYGPMKLSSVSGYLNYYDVESEDAVIETTSGDVFVSDALAETMSVKTVSGDVNISDIGTQALTVSTTSGDMWLTLPDRPEDYSVKVNTVSGDINGVENRTGGRRDLVLSSVSGDIRVTFE